MSEFSFDYFCEEASRFNEMMGMRGYTIQQREIAFRAIGRLMLHTECDTDEQKESLKKLFAGLFENYSRRMVYIEANRTFCECKPEEVAELLGGKNDS